MKRIILSLLVAVMVVAMAGCGGGSGQVTPPVTTLTVDEVNAFLDALETAYVNQNVEGVVLSYKDPYLEIDGEGYRTYFTRATTRANFEDEEEEISFAFNERTVTITGDYSAKIDCTLYGRNHDLITDAILEADTDAEIYISKSSGVPLITMVVFGDWVVRDK